MKSLHDNRVDMLYVGSETVIHGWIKVFTLELYLTPNMGNHPNYAEIIYSQLFIKNYKIMKLFCRRTVLTTDLKRKQVPCELMMLYDWP